MCIRDRNSTFRDRYLEVPYDLSKVMFITTANSLDTIPGPLRDRMEIIELSGYTLEEKKEIAARYLIPKQLAANGLTEALSLIHISRRDRARHRQGQLYVGGGSAGLRPYR